MRASYVGKVVDLSTGKKSVRRGGDGSKSKLSTLVSSASGRCGNVMIAGSDVMARRIVHYSKVQPAWRRNKTRRVRVFTDANAGRVVVLN